MTFGEKLKQERLSRKMSQAELAGKVGVSERSLYSYEQLGRLPRSGVLQKLASALGVSTEYLMDDNTDDKQKGLDGELFIAAAKDEFGYKGAREAQAVLDRASALFAGGELDEEAKEIFFQSLMSVYLESKAEAREKFTGKRKKSSKA